MQVRPGHPSRRAHRGQRVAGLEHIAHLHVPAAQVAVHRQQTAAVVDPDGAAVEEVVAGVDHLAGQRRAHGRAGAGCDVHAAVRIARLAVEHAAQAERAGAAARHGHAHLQRGVGAQVGERGHHAGQVIALLGVASLVLGRQVDRARRHCQALFAVLLRGDGVGDLALGLVALGAHADAGFARWGGERNADQRGPFDRIAQHQQRHVAGESLGARGGGAERQAGDAAGHQQGAWPDIGRLRLAVLLGRGRGTGRQRQQAEGAEHGAAAVQCSRREIGERKVHVHGQDSNEELVVRRLSRRSVPARFRARARRACRARWRRG
ncbi:hypothetical protein D3C86_885940 [compost metagenome]